jgi:hypothetical protein
VLRFSFSLKFVSFNFDVAHGRDFLPAAIEALKSCGIHAEDAANFYRDPLGLSGDGDDDDLLDAIFGI